MIDLIELDPAELARIHDVPAELVRCRYCRFAERRPAAGGLAYAAYCTYWEDTVNPKTCCTSWQPRRKESEEMEEKRVEELTETSMAGSPVININMESGAMLTINFWTDDAEDDDDED